MMMTMFTVYIVISLCFFYVVCYHGSIMSFEITTQRDWISSNASSKEVTFYIISKLNDSW